MTAAKKKSIRKRITAMVGAAALIAGLSTTIVYRPWSSYPVATTTTSTSTTTTTSGGSDSYLTPPYQLMPDSVFNQNVTGWSLLSNSATLVTNWSNMVSASTYGVGVNFNRPFFWIPSGTSNASMGVSSGCTTFVGSTPGQSPSSVPIPSDTFVGPSSDEIVTVYNQTNEYEYWLTVKNSSSSWDACYGGSTATVTGNMGTFTGVFPNNYGETATSIANVATVIMESDVDQALPYCVSNPTAGATSAAAGCVIHHAIGYDVFAGYCDGYVSPATRGDCGSTANYPSEGMYFRFASGTTCSACTTPFSEMVFNTILTYGMVAIDQGGAVQLEAEDTDDWAANGESNISCPTSGTNDPISCSLEGQAEYSVVDNLPWSSLQALAYP